MTEDADNPIPESSRDRVEFFLKLAREASDPAAAAGFATAAAGFAQAAAIEMAEWSVSQRIFS